MLARAAPLRRHLVLSTKLGRGLTRDVPGTSLTAKSFPQWLKRNSWPGRIGDLRGAAAGIGARTRTFTGQPKITPSTTLIRRARPTIPSANADMTPYACALNCMAGTFMPGHKSRQREEF